MPFGFIITIRVPSTTMDFNASLSTSFLCCQCALDSYNKYYFDIFLKYNRLVLIIQPADMPTFDLLESFKKYLTLWYH